MLSLLTAAAALLASASASPLPSAPSVTSIERRWADEGVVWAHVNQGRNILGDYQKCTWLCDWMSWYPDETKLVDINIPGTHDTATWNYTQATQDIYLNLTTTAIPPAIIYQCQDTSIFEQLNAGNRAFDLRIGNSPEDNTTIIFYHAPAILSLSATFEDILYGFYKFLDDNPSETIMLSVKVDNTTFGTQAGLQKQLYDILFSEPALSYFSQQNATLGSLGDSRGKINLIRRFDWGQLPAEDTQRIGLAAGPEVWLDNIANFTIEYATDEYIYVEDYYEIGGPPGAETKTLWKYNATVAHLEYAAASHLDSPFITFSSAEKDSDVPPEYPRILALGNGSVPGVNQRLVPWLNDHLDERRGIVFTDWSHHTPGLVEAIIGYGEQSYLDRL